MTADTSPFFHCYANLSQEHFALVRNGYAEGCETFTAQGESVLVMAVLLLSFLF